MTARHTFSRQELEKYFDRICMPPRRRSYDVSSLPDSNKLSFLNVLQKHQLVKVPWENTVQHYSWHRVVNVKPNHLFNKIVNDPGRGGYCMEANYFYHCILRSLGFDVYMAGSRIYRTATGSYGGWSHVVNLVTIGNQKYIVDGGFGGQGPSCPVLLEHGLVSAQIAPAQMRLMYEPIAENLDRSQRVWIFQYRFNENSLWAPMYCFTDLEFTPADIEGMNFQPWLDRQSFFTHKVVAVRFTTDKEGDSIEGPGSPNEEALEGEIDGSMTINHDTLKWRRHGQKVVVIPFKTESDRVLAFRKYFGIILADEDKKAIIGTAAQIGVKAMGLDD